jgi:hypothetical protein
MTCREVRAGSVALMTAGSSLCGVVRFGDPIPVEDGSWALRGVLAGEPHHVLEAAGCV